MVVLAAVAFIVVHQVDNWLRPRVEARVNAALKGYTARIPALHLNLLKLGLTLIEARVSQDAYPAKPVIVMDRFDIGVHWRALLHGKLVADLEIDRPKLDIDLKRLTAEAEDKVNLEDKGWQEAVEAIYPLKINRIEIDDGDLTYVDDDPKHPLRIRDAWFVAENIRNVRSPDGVYPSNFELKAVVFDSGKLAIDGRANFLAAPVAAVDADIDLQHVELDKLRPVAAHANLKISKGILSAKGHTTYTAKKRVAKLNHLSIDGVQIQYLHQPQTKVVEEKRLEKVKQTAKDVSNEPDTLIEVDEMQVRNSRLGYVDQTRKPGYEVFVSDARIDVRGLTNQATKEPAWIWLDGRFYDAGPIRLEMTMRPVEKTPEFNVKLEIDATPLSAMNDLLLSYGNFDVAAGQFAFYSELTAENGRLSGYVKPIFTDMDVYDRRQDKNKPLFHEIYEAIIGGIATILQNREEDVATKADISGRVDEPNVSTWQVVVRLIGNAFFKTIVPGFESNLKKD